MKTYMGIFNGRIPVRGIFLMSAALVLAAIIGCGNNDDRRPPPDQARAPESGSRVNLYPMSAPPPAANQPQGYAPTRITAAQYTPDQTYGGYQQTPTYSTTQAGYTAPRTGYSNQTVAYGPGAAPPPLSSTAPAPFAGGVGSGAFNTPSGYCTFEDVTAYSNPNVPIGDPPIVINNPTGGVVYAGPSSRSPFRAEGGSGISYGSVEGTADIVRPVGPMSSPYAATTTYSPPVTTYSSPTYSTTTYAAPTTTTYSTTTTAPISTTTYTSSPTLSSTTTTTTYTTPGPTTYTAMPVATYQTSSTPAAYPSVSAVPASFTAGGAPAAGQYKLVPAPDVPPGRRPNDAAPSQWFEIVRPDNGPLRIGRVSATCVCVGVRVPERQIAAGQRALIEARVLTKPPVNNLTYGIYVNIVEPTTTVVDADITIRY